MIMHPVNSGVGNPTMGGMGGVPGITGTDGARFPPPIIATAIVVALLGFSWLRSAGEQVCYQRITYDERVCLLISATRQPAGQRSFAQIS
jgi:hypothetical protein